MIKDLFLKLGFNEKEADIYLTLNTLGPCLASTLAKKCGIKRTSIYDILNRLIEKNLISIVKQGNNSFYIADDPKKILLYEKERIQIAENVSHLLLAQREHQEEIGIQYYQGFEGFQEIYDDILTTSTQEIVGWMNFDFFLPAIPPSKEVAWTKKRIKQKIKGRLFVTDGEIGKKMERESMKLFREIRIIPKELSFKSSCMIYHDSITFFDNQKFVVGIRIRHPELAKMLKHIFEMQWETTNQN